ncbi:hypothetical protein K469DRAFT_545034, partial [Zopfia rhizophila CBS 207.26]
YFQAVIQEGLRIFPPAPEVFPRLIPEGVGFALGEYLPERLSSEIFAPADTANENTH